jgi:DNA-binding HxlR family transcriptional regulator
MRKRSLAELHTPVACALDEIDECTKGTRRFGELQRRLGIARNLLTTRLKRLGELGILERIPMERSNIQGYRLTPKGDDLRPVLTGLTKWGDRWLAPQNQTSPESSASISRSDPL